MALSRSRRALEARRGGKGRFFVTLAVAGAAGPSTPLIRVRSGRRLELNPFSRFSRPCGSTHDAFDFPRTASWAIFSRPFGTRRKVEKKVTGSRGHTVNVASFG